MAFRPQCLALAPAALVLLGADQPARNLEIDFIDVMGGAATLLVTPERESVLIDSGWPGLEDRDPKRIEHVPKDIVGLDHLDHLVTVHSYADHFGGVKGLEVSDRIGPNADNQATRFNSVRASYQLDKEDHLRQERTLSTMRMRMRLRLAWLAPILMVGVGASPPSNRGTERIFPFPIRQTTLENGLTVLSVPFDSPGIIAYYTMVRTGSRNEVEKGLSGFAHFFEHMMFRGTERYPQEKYNDVLKALGAYSNAFTTDDWTCYHMTIPASALATAVEIEADRFRHLKYDESTFQKEARAVLGEYNKGASSPSLILSETMQDKAYTTHTYKHTTIGFLADVKDMPNQFAYSKTFFDRWYRPENCTIVVAGDVDHNRLVELVREAYGGWERGKASVTIPTEPEQTSPRSAKQTWPLPTLPILYLGYHIPAADPTNPDTAALGALAQAAFGEASPLYKKLVLDEQKVDLLAAEAEAKRDPGLFTILARVRTPDDVADVRTQIESALAEAAKSPIDPARLDVIKSHLRYAFAGSLDSAGAVALAVGQSIATTGRPDAMNDLYAAYDRLTPADLRRVAGRYFVPTNETVVTLESEKKK